MKRRRQDFCPECGALAMHVSSRYDRFFCKDCRVWCEDICGCSQDKCEFRDREPIDRPDVDEPTFLV